MSVAQQEALDRLGPRWLVPVSTQLLDPREIFGRSAPLILEIGSGMGASTVTLAATEPDLDVLAVDVHTPGVGQLLHLADQAQVTNVRAVLGDAVEVVDRMLPDCSLNGVRVFFPDPWPKMRHRNRRLIQPDFVALVVPRLKPGGYIHCATDAPDYAEQMLSVFGAHLELDNPYVGPAPRPANRPITKFEGRAHARGHQITDVWVTRTVGP